MNILGAGNNIPGKKFVGVNGDRNRIRGTSEPFLKIPKKIQLTKYETDNINLQ